MQIQIKKERIFRNRPYRSFITAEQNMFIIWDVKTVRLSEFKSSYADKKFQLKEMHQWIYNTWMYCQGKMWLQSRLLILFSFIGQFENPVEWEGMW